jgi:hypothetical protein
LIRLTPALLLLLAACAKPAAPAPAPDTVPNDKCHAERVQDLIGQPRSDALGETARQRAGAGVIRWIPMGVMVTMDYRFDRLDLRLGPDGKITAITCG